MIRRVTLKDGTRARCWYGAFRPWAQLDLWVVTPANTLVDVAASATGVRSSHFRVRVTGKAAIMGVRYVEGFAASLTWTAALKALYGGVESDRLAVDGDGRESILKGGS